MLNSDAPSGEKPLKFVIYAGTFNENLGGVVALHTLCNLLNKLGHKSYLWPDTRPAFKRDQPFSSVWKILKYKLRRRERQYKTGQSFQTPVASAGDLQDAIVVYAETIDGNPLKAKRVVRWLLHKPGFHTGRVNYGADERFFFYMKAFDDPALNSEAENLLVVPTFSAQFYRQTNFGKRQGTCYVLRKGEGRRIVHDLRGSVLVDGLSHAAMAEVFNRAETCISYDTYTMYSAFAALCGCISVVVPEEGVSVQQWRPDVRDRYGIAYGFDDIDHAVMTRHLVLPRLKEQEGQANETVRHFVAKCAEYFPN